MEYTEDLPNPSTLSQQELIARITAIREKLLAHEQAPDKNPEVEDSELSYAILCIRQTRITSAAARGESAKKRAQAEITPVSLSDF